VHHQHLRLLLEEVHQGITDPQVAFERLRNLPYEDLGFAKVDHHRPLRQGFPEVIYCPGKTAEQITAILNRLQAYPGNILATRASQEIYEQVKGHLPQVEFKPLSRAMTIHRDKTLYAPGTILIVSAGTADIPVAEEAAITAELMGNKVETLFDVGVAGIHRLLDHGKKLDQASVIVVVAGMEGALPSVVGGLVSCPIVAVPTSAGYGANFSGLAPLLAMLNSCAAGVSVVNIDNGFGAGYSAALINRVSAVPGNFLPGVTGNP